MKNTNRFNLLTDFSAAILHFFVPLPCLHKYRRMNPENYYHERLASAEGQLRKVKQQIARVSALRVGLFVAGLAGIYCFFHQPALLTTSICLTFLPFSSS